MFWDKAEPVSGPLMAYEGLTAFFLEAGFLCVMLLGMGRASRTLHFTATVVAAFGTLLSATWILTLNSWMQEPAGYGIHDVGQFIPEDGLAIIFNPFAASSQLSPKLHIPAPSKTVRRNCHA